jgi:hypothetical protein
MARFESVLAVRVNTDVEREPKRRARADDRPLSSYLRRTLTALVKPDVNTERVETRSATDEAEP